MGKARKKAKQRSLFPKLDEIISLLVEGKPQDVVILIIPSHDQREEALTDQDQWASAAMELFADLFGGATAFRAFKGVYKTSDRRVLWDVPIFSLNRTFKGST